MSQATAIGWTDLSWNPTHGCSIVSTECRHCYAQTLSLKYKQTLKPWTPANAAENVLLKPHKLREPLSNAKIWRGLGAAAALAGKTDGMLVFTNSMSDLFHEQVPDDFIARVFSVMATADRHTFQVLTKRPARARDLLGSDQFRAMVQFGAYDEFGCGRVVTWPLPNVWLGTSIGLRQFVGRADHLRATPAAVRFLSCEPLLGPLVAGISRWRDVDGAEGWREKGRTIPELDLTGIDWVIAGGESGPGHRPMDLDWVRGLRDACLNQYPGPCSCGTWLTPANAREGRCRVCGEAAFSVGGLGRTAFFFKQHGGARPGGPRELDGREWSEFPTSGVRHSTAMLADAMADETLAALRAPYPCDGCGAEKATEALWLAAPLGLCCVWVHKIRECAQAARERRGGGKFVTLGPGR